MTVWDKIPRPFCLIFTSWDKNPVPFVPIWGGDVMYERLREIDEAIAAGREALEALEDARRA